MDGATNMEIYGKQAPEKFRVPDKSFPSFYLPSIKSIFKRLKLPHNLPLQLKAAEDYYDINCKLTINLRNKMVRGGINYKHRETYLNFVRQIIGPKGFDTKVMEEIFSGSYGVGSNAGAWLVALEGYSQTKALKLSLPVMEFIRNRAESDLAFLESSKSNGIGKKDDHAQYEWMAAFVSKNTLVDNDVIKKAVETHSKTISPGDYSSFKKSDWLNVLRFNLSFEADFYLSAIAIYDLAIHSYYFGRLRKANQPYFLEISEKYSKIKIVRNLFEGLLDILRRQNTSQANKPLAWNSLAQYIETSDPHNLMNKWRRGKELPSSYLFSSFIDKLDFPEDEVEKFIIKQYMQISIALDSLVSEWASTGKKILNELEQQSIQVNQEELDDLIREVINGLEKYYEAFSCQNSKK